MKLHYIAAFAKGAEMGQTERAIARGVPRRLLELSRGAALFQMEDRWGLLSMGNSERIVLVGTEDQWLSGSEEPCPDDLSARFMAHLITTRAIEVAPHDRAHMRAVRPILEALPIGTVVAVRDIRGNVVPKRAGELLDSTTAAE